MNATTRSQTLDFPREMHGVITLPPGCVISVESRSEFVMEDGDYLAMPVVHYTVKLPRLSTRQGLLGSLYRAVFRDWRWDSDSALDLMPRGDVYVNGRLVGATHIVTVLGIGFCRHDTFRQPDGTLGPRPDRGSGRPISKLSFGIVRFHPSHNTPVPAVTAAA